MIAVGIVPNIQSTSAAAAPVGGGASASTWTTAIAIVVVLLLLAGLALWQSFAHRDGPQGGGWWWRRRRPHPRPRTPGPSPSWIRPRRSSTLFRSTLRCSLGAPVRVPAGSPARRSRESRAPSA